MEQKKPVMVGTIGHRHVGVTRHPSMTTMLAAAALMQAAQAEPSKEKRKKIEAVKPDRLTPNFEAVAKAITGTRDFDQIFINEHHGYFNAGKMLRLILAKPQNVARQRLPITEDLIEYISSFVEIDQKLLNEMTPARYDEPILGVELIDRAPLLIIDGHHRVLKRWLQGLRDVEILIMPNKKLHTIRATHEQVQQAMAELNRPGTNWSQPRFRHG